MGAAWGTRRYVAFIPRHVLPVIINNSGAGALRSRGARNRVGVLKEEIR
jgi:hypothetical protein